MKINTPIEEIRRGIARDCWSCVNKDGIDLVLVFGYESRVRFTDYKVNVKSQLFKDIDEALEMAKEDDEGKDKLTWS